jgi:broad specificity phosphatase PhoE
MTDFYIFRHGDTIETGKWWFKFIGRKYDSRNIRILPKAKYGLEGIGKFLKNIKTDANFTSPYIRCIESSDIVGRISHKKYQPDDRIRELERNGESLRSFNERVRSFFDEIRSNNYSAVSICTHGAVIGTLKHLAKRDKFCFFHVLDYPNPGNLIIIKDGMIKTLDFNK